VTLSVDQTVFEGDDRELGALAGRLFKRVKQK
jgi:hypothetical protein